MPNNTQDIISLVFAVILHWNPFHYAASRQTTTTKNKNKNKKNKTTQKKVVLLKNQVDLISLSWTVTRMLYGAGNYDDFFFQPVQWRWTRFNIFKTTSVVKFQIPHLLAYFLWVIDPVLFLVIVVHWCTKPSDSIASMMSRGPVVSVSYTNRPLLVANATDAFSIPFLLVRFDSIKCTHEEQVMPVICKNNRNKILHPSYYWTTV